MKALTTSYAIAIFLFCSISAFAQPATIKWGTPFKIEQEGSEMRLISTTETGSIFIETGFSYTYAKETGGSYIFLDEFDKSGNLIKQNRVKIIIKGLPCFAEKFIAIDDKIFAFTLTVDSDKERYVLYGVELDRNGVQQNATELESVKIGTIKYTDLMRAYRVRVSEDESSILLFTKPPFNRNDDEGSLKYQMFDSDLGLIWSTSFTPPKGQKINEYLLFNIPNSAQVMMQDNSTDETVFYAYDDEFEKHSTASLGYINNNTDNFYADGDSLIQFINVEMDENGVPVAINQDYFTPDNIEKTDSKRIQLSNDQVNAMIDPDFVEDVQRQGRHDANGIRVLPRSDMGYYIIFENSYEDWSNYLIPKYHSLKISVISIDSNFKLQWITEIPKKQVSKHSGGRFASYQIVYNDSNLCLVYNENPRNTGSDYKKYQEANTNLLHTTVVAMAHVNHNGQLKKYTLSKTLIPGVGKFDPLNAFRIDGNEVLFGASDVKKYSLGRLKLE